MKEEKRTALDVLGEMYLPEFVALRDDGDYSGKSVVFNFNPNEPRVVSHPLNYLTPRGLHLCLSQASYCFYEHLVMNEKMSFDLNTARDIYFQMRLRITELNQKFRKEMRLSSFQGKLNLDRLRVGDRFSLARFSFDMGNRAIVGDLTTMIAPHSVPQTNIDTLRH